LGGREFHREGLLHRLGQLARREFEQDKHEHKKVRRERNPEPEAEAPLVHHPPQKVSEADCLSQQAGGQESLG